MRRPPSRIIAHRANCGKGASGFGELATYMGIDEHRDPASSNSAIQAAHDPCQTTTVVNNACRPSTVPGIKSYQILVPDAVNLVEPG